MQIYRSNNIKYISEYNKSQLNLREAIIPQ
jgi:hypothetical protein